MFEVDRMEIGSVVLVTEYDPATRDYEYISEPSPGEDDDWIECVWLSWFTGYTESRVSGNRYDFTIAGGEIKSQSPGSAHKCKHYRAVEDALEFRNKQWGRTYTTQRVECQLETIQAEEQDGRARPSESKQVAIYLPTEALQLPTPGLDVEAILRCLNDLRAGWRVAGWRVAEDPCHDDWF
jgi:hypothetical protein